MTRLLQIAAVLTMVGLALMVWSMAAPTPMPVILAMSAGQLLGTLAFGLFGYVVLVDQLRKQRAKGAAAAALAAVAAVAETDAAAVAVDPAVPAPTGEALP